MQARDRRILFILVFTVLVFMWQSTLIAPLKILVVFLHELSHALATWLTGGKVVEFVVSAYQSGHVISAGGSRFIILSAGYLGSLLFGLLFYAASSRRKTTDISLALLAITMLLVAVFFGGTLYTIGFSAVIALVIMVLLKYASAGIKQTVLLVFASASMIYVPIDIWQDTIIHSGSLSDARMLANEMGGATFMWGGLWFVASLYFIYLTLRKS
ncbi:M50 family metallopeptidase [Moritella sp.]|uniref:M50 family metallopeptidase n=1 Tax=Moritella sp. TaxID=78556 RepID=UPI001DB88F7F|nr:M50 family metallopeptidase [Moritella sp.]MCJ8348384.1 M50 family metallopeptidase [Moritella sp.]NQZ38904.1 M50 family metallopeptidase [Moritella sp.]